MTFAVIAAFVLLILWSAIKAGGRTAARGLKLLTRPLDLPPRPDLPPNRFQHLTWDEILEQTQGRK